MKTFDVFTARKSCFLKLRGIATELLRGAGKKYSLDI